MTSGAARAAAVQFALYRRLLASSVIVSLLEPLLYLLGLGVGVGALVDRHPGSQVALGGLTYLAYVAPGLLVSTAMTLGALDSLWPVRGGLKWNRTYHAQVATPLDAGDIVGGHALFMTGRALISVGSVAVVLAFVDDTRTWGLIPAVAVAALVSLAFAMPCMAYAAATESETSFPAIQRFVIIPLFLFGGAFYPIGQLPVLVQWMARTFPLWHGVVVARAFTADHVEALATVAHLGYVAAWIVVGWLLARRSLHARLHQ